MAKKAKGNRVQVILECTEQKASGVPGMSRYITTKNKKNTPDRLEHKIIREEIELWQRKQSQRLQPRPVPRVW